MLSTTSTKFGSKYLTDGSSEGDEIWQIDRGDLAAHQYRDFIGLLCPRETPWGAKILKGVKKFATFVSYIVWHFGPER